MGFFYQIVFHEELDSKLKSIKKKSWISCESMFCNEWEIERPLLIYILISFLGESCHCAVIAPGQLRAVWRIHLGYLSHFWWSFSSAIQTRSMANISLAEWLMVLRGPWNSSVMWICLIKQQISVGCFAGIFLFKVSFWTHAVHTVFTSPNRWTLMSLCLEV